VEVVEYEEEGPSLSASAKELGNGLEETETRGLRVDCGRSRRNGHNVSDLWNKLGEIAGTAP
jgi:hypothetical protein